jgi:signal transduction histidine kinase
MRSRYATRNGGAITRTEFDGRQLERWHLSERALPPGSVVQFREPRLWRDHPVQVLSVLAAIGTQTVLIVVLMLERGRRRVAEVEGRENLLIAARAERQVLAGTLAGAIAHELNQPLGSILLNAETADRLLLTSEDLLPGRARELTRSTRRW